jgi:hypothetical protein
MKYSPTLLPYARVKTYDLKKDIDRTFANEADALAFVEKCGTKLFNLYRIEKVNGTWRTDWTANRAYAVTMNS